MRRTGKHFLIYIITWILFTFSLNAEVSSSNQPSIDLWKYVRRIILPDPLPQMYELRSFIASDEYRESVRTLPHGNRVDIIYLHAVELTEGNILESLLICAVATLPYHTFDAVVPLFQLVIPIPVSTETREQFQKRLTNLPTQLFDDSKPGEDQDKLTHFFGSAYLTCVLKAPATVEGIGYLIELFESVFKLQGSEDDRDIQANERGITFGKDLMAARDVLPSKYFHVSLKK